MVTLIMRNFFLLFCLSVSMGSNAQVQQKPLTTIAFGSCDNQYVKPKFWMEINALHPQLWIWGGDIVYGDTYDMDTLRHKYNVQKNQPGYQELLSYAEVTGVYDDHDYGLNDGGSNYKRREESRDILFDFLNIPANDSIRKREGGYSSRVYGPAGKQVKVINLDTRYFRDQLEKETYTNAAGQQETRYKSIPDRDILGDAQWLWLERELKTAAEVTIINSSIQLISSEHRFEKWANFPTAQERLYKLIAASGKKGIFVISGDRHIAELSSVRLPGMNYPLYDFTSSGMTHTWPAYREETNSHRVGKLIAQKNFGVINIDWSGKHPQVRVQIQGRDNAVFAEYPLDLYL